MPTSRDHLQWFDQFKASGEYARFQEKPVAYFCAEYALDSDLPTYAGGLGVLAGDFVREAAAREFPLVAVGLRYQRAQSALSQENGGENLKLEKVAGPDGQDIIVSLPLAGRVVSAKAFRWQEGKTSVYLLDTDIPENAPEDREITKRLYDEDRGRRLKQEIVLGIGGFRLLARLGIHASVYHLNEGHSAFLSLELMRHEMEHQGASWADAITFAKKHIIFTNHTLVPEGQERFAQAEVAEYMDAYAREMGATGDKVALLGKEKENPGAFSMTALSFELSSRSNAVSRLHMAKAQTMWRHEAVDFVTNGVFAGRWDKIRDPRDLWGSHLQNKRKLLQYVKDKGGAQWQEGDLICAWARRLVEYKQPLFLAHHADRLLQIAKNSPVPLRVILSGPTGGVLDNPFTEEIKKVIAEKLKEYAVFLPNYSTGLAEILTAGADVWLNTPIYGTEACGTSGMKAGLNGGLALSTADGWVYEVNPEDIGWVSNDGASEELLDLLEKEILPMYAEHLRKPDNSLWLGKMAKTRDFIGRNFSTTRMLREYIDKLYIPVLNQKHAHKHS